MHVRIKPATCIHMHVRIEPATCPHVCDAEEDPFSIFSEKLEAYVSEFLYYLDQPTIWLVVIHMPS